MMAVKGIGRRIDIRDEDRVELELIVRSSSSSVRIVERAQIVLAAAEGMTGKEIADRVGCSLPTVVKWRGRYATGGIGGLRDAPRSGAPPTHGPHTRALLIAKACARPAASGDGQRRERLTYEELGRAVGMSASHAHLILSQAAIKPRLTDDWIISDFSRDDFEQQSGDVCGLYLDAPEHVLVVSIDEAPAIQGKTPTKPDEPPAPRTQPRRQRQATHAQGVFGCLDGEQGDLRAMPSNSLNRVDLSRFLDTLDAEIAVVEGRRLFAVTDTLSASRTEELQVWLGERGRWHVQFTPTHASWLNQIEIFFSILWRRLLDDGILASEQDLAEQMLAFVETHNQTGAPFTWTRAGNVLEG